MLAMAQNRSGQTRPPENIFVPAPAIVPTATRLKTPMDAEAKNQTFRPAPAPAKSKMDASKTEIRHPREDPNIWVPRSLEKERLNHPNNQAQGTQPRRSLMQPQRLAEGHPFFPTLHEWGSEGVPVDCGPDWEWDVIEQAVARGPHRSAMEPENIALVHEDIKYQVDAGFSRIMLWSDLQKLRPRNLKISPMAVVPQKDRRGRLILDLSFPVYPERTKST
jgi:hypothetical protein